MKRTAFLVFLAACALRLPAQIEGDPRAKMKEILDEVAQEMQQIDKWLQESSRSKDAAAGMQRNAERINKLLDSVGKSQRQVVKGIDDLLKEAEKMKSQGQPEPGSQEQQQKQRRPGQQQQDQSERDRQGQARRLQRPEGQQQPRDQMNQKQGDQERNNREETEAGRNDKANKPPNGGTEKVESKKVQGSWGELPDYILKHGRGSMPDVPEKYRKYLEAMTREAAKKESEGK